MSDGGVMPTPIPGVAVILTDYDGRMILWGKRHPAASYGGCWEISGGKVEYGEQCSDAARREIREELGVEIDKLDFFDTIAHEAGGNWYVTVVYTGRCGDPPAADQRETQEVVWSDTPPRPVTPYSEGLWLLWSDHKADPFPLPGEEG